MKTEPFKLEHVTKDTIVCDQTILNRAKEAITNSVDLNNGEQCINDFTDIIEVLRGKDVSKCYIDGIESILSIVSEDKGCIPYLIEHLEKQKDLFRACIQLLKDNEKCRLEDYTTEDSDTVNGILECLEVDQDQLANLENYIKEYLVGKYPASLEYLETNLLHEKLAENILSADLDVRITEGYYANDYDFNLYYWSIDEIEDQWCYSDMKYHCELLEGYTNKELQAVFEALENTRDYGIQVNDYCVWQYIYNPMQYYCGIDESNVKELVDDYLENSIELEELEKLNYLTISGIRCAHTTGSCSCCGFSPSNKDDDFMTLWNAGWSDSDGVFYSRLCGDTEGYGCIYDIEPDTTSEVEATARDVFGNDLDGIADIVEYFRRKELEDNDM